MAAMFLSDPNKFRNFNGDLHIHNLYQLTNHMDLVLNIVQANLNKELILPHEKEIKWGTFVKKNITDIMNVGRPTQNDNNSSHDLLGHVS